MTEPTSPSGVGGAYSAQAGVSGAHSVTGTRGSYSTETQPAEDRSLGSIVSDITQDFSTLMRQEIELAKTETKQEISKAGKGAGLLGGAGVFGHLALIALTLFLVFLLDNWMDLAWAALIVTVLWAIVAGVLAMVGKKQLQRVDPKLPTTQRTLKEDVQWAKAQKNS